ncbi:MAG: NAD(P)/FAD-dependent oxidoreductase, partial [Methanobrevibacter boviskoreani]|uniref:NAD(P)/FAD-dependent oxidoreductase n=1 Tax=Methanobrevibacter boviskoreani TaxID=1348249 RepID=UPI003D902E9F
RAGAEIKIKTLAKGVTKTDDGYIVSCEQYGKDIDIKAKIIIAADGPESHIGRWAGLKTAQKAVNMESGVQYEMCNLHFERPGVIEFYFGSCAPGGYVWVFPKGDDIANVGLAILAPHADKVNPGKTAKEYLDDWIATSPITKDAQAVELNVGGDPVGGMPKKIYADNIMVCGDAAGQVNPLTGGGIISGMTGGMYAGQVAAEAIKKGDCSAKFLKKYDKLVRDDIGDEIKKYAVVQDYMLGLKDEDLDKIAHEFVDVDFSKVSTTQLVKALIKVSPSAALKLGKYFL